MAAGIRRYFKISIFLIICFIYPAINFFIEQDITAQEKKASAVKEQKAGKSVSAKKKVPANRSLPDGNYTQLARQATVKINKTYISPNYCVPWKMKNYSSAVGSGAIIKGGLIITNAHVVSDSTFLQVQKENDPVSYEADILYVGHDCDLAVLKVKDAKFFNNTVSLEFGGIPELRSKVATYGYPMGGERISITEGIVSRIEVGVYSHSNKAAFLEIQTDAAINPGNSGGPVIQDGKIAGIAFQAMADSSNIGYMIPVPVIRHFLDDIKDGTYDGFPDVGILTDSLLNDSYREYLGMGSRTGIIVTRVVQGSAADGRLKANDVILAIDGNMIANDSTISFGDGRILFSVLVDQKQAGDSMEFEILREKRVQKITIALKDISARIPWYDEFEVMPRYYIYGGIVFQPLNREFLKCWDKWWFKADRKLLYYFSYVDRDNIDPDRSEFIIINHVLPDPVNTYFSEITDAVLDRINNVRIRKLEDVVEAFSKPAGKYHIIEVKGYSKPIILNAADVEEAHSRILKKYEIPSDRRID